MHSYAPHIGEWKGIDILPTAKAGGFPTSRWGFPASLEVAARTPSGSFGLTPPPQAFAFPEPQGSFSVWRASGTWFLFPGRKKESVQWLNTLVLLPRRAI